MSELIFSIIQDNLHLLLEELFIALALPPTFWAVLEVVTQYALQEDDCPNKEVLNRIDLATSPDHYINNFVSDLKKNLLSNKRRKDVICFDCVSNIKCGLKTQSFDGK
jgi:hypothetical protein